MFASQWSKGMIHPPRPSLNQVERFALMFLLDGALLSLALYVSLWQRKAFDLTPGHASVSKWFATLWLVWLLTVAVFNLYSRNRIFSRSLKFQVQDAVAALFCASAYYLIPRMTPILPGRRLEVLLFPLMAFLVILFVRLGVVSRLRRALLTKRVVIYGAGRAASSLMAVLAASADRRQANLEFEVRALLDDDPEKKGMRLNGVEVRGGLDQLIPCLHQEEPHELILAITNRSTLKLELIQALLKLREAGWSVRSMQAVYEEVSGKIPVDHIGDVFSALFDHPKTPFFRLYCLLNVLINRTIGLVGSFLTTALVPVILLGNLFWSRGPLMYVQERVGLGGSIFRIYKFRSMIPQAEQLSGAVWAKKDDERITPFGRFLRKSRLDELPQFFNILKGDMLLIGPRPERPEFVHQLEKEIPYYNLRHGIKPGVTGWAQTNYPYGASVEDALEKLQYDLYYAKYQNPVLDLSILLKTVGVVMRFRGR
jgi:exopolysaccharide biosynthesis polyprenyl glycosylphosphotransferase